MRHPALTVGWVLVLGLLPLVLAVCPLTLSILWLAAVLMSMFTVGAVSRTPLALVRPRWYRLTVGALVLASALGMVGAASIVGIDRSGGRHFPLALLAGTQLAVAVLGWRAFVRPSARGAALVGMVAVTGMLAAPIATTILVIGRAYGWATVHSRWAGVLVETGYLGTTVLGAFASVAALTSFDTPSTLPEARSINASPGA